MAITPEKKRRLIADWKAGAYKRKRDIAKAYNVSPNSVTGYLKGVEKGVYREIIDKNIDSRQEILAVASNPEEAQAIKNEIDRGFNREQEMMEFKKTAFGASRMIMDVVIRKVKHDGKLVSVKIGKKTAKEVVPLDMNDLHLAQKTVDLALISTGVADRHAPKGGDVNVHQQQGIQGSLFSDSSSEQKGIGSFYEEIEAEVITGEASA